jgi:hypothetical protein
LRTPAGFYGNVQPVSLFIQGPILGTSKQIWPQGLTAAEVKGSKLAEESYYNIFANATVFFE